MDIRLIIRIDELIRRNATGAPAELASRLGVSERTLFHYLKFMREELNAPIVFSSVYNTYSYDKNGKFNFYWKKT